MKSLGIEEAGEVITSVFRGGPGDTTTSWFKAAAASSQQPSSSGPDASPTPTILFLPSGVTNLGSMNPFSDLRKWNLTPLDWVGFDLLEGRGEIMNLTGGAAVGILVIVYVVVTRGTNFPHYFEKMEGDQVKLMNTALKSLNKDYIDEKMPFKSNRKEYTPPRITACVPDFIASMLPLAEERLKPHHRFFPVFCLPAQVSLLSHHFSAEQRKKLFDHVQNERDSRMGGALKKGKNEFNAAQVADIERMVQEGKHVQESEKINYYAEADELYAPVGRNLEKFLNG